MAVKVKVMVMATVVMVVVMAVVMVVVMAVATQLVVVAAEVLRRWQRNDDPQICPSSLMSSVARPTGGQDALAHPSPAASCSVLENSCCPFQFLKFPFLLRIFLSV